MVARLYPTLATFVAVVLLVDTGRAAPLGPRSPVHSAEGVAQSRALLPRVAIDAGHGGTQFGARGICGVWEKDITLAVAKRIARVLTASGQIAPLMVRDDDITLSLEARSAFANAQSAELFLSIHANASTMPEARGIETFFLALNKAHGRLARLIERENEGRRVPHALPHDPLAVVLQSLSLDSAHRESQALAINMQRALVGHLRTRGRGVLQAPFLVLLGAKMPAALVEIGFLTNAAECTRLTSQAGQDEIAEAIAAGVLAHLSAQQPLTAQAHGALRGSSGA